MVFLSHFLNHKFLRSVGSDELGKAADWQPTRAGDEGEQLGPVVVVKVAHQLPKPTNL